MKYAVEMDSGGIVKIPKFHTDRFKLSKVVRGYTYRHTDSKLTT
jgi:hypothetical protein